MLKIANTGDGRPSPQEINKPKTKGYNYEVPDNPLVLPERKRKTTTEAQVTKMLEFK